MTCKNFDSLCSSLADVSTSREFEGWVRGRFRRVLPHAAMLVTIGKLFVSGSMPTHRIGVDYPLNLVEDVKTNTGAINDPMVCGFLRTERVQFLKVEDWVRKNGDQDWCGKLKGYGIESMLVFGFLDHKNRRFAIVQIINPVRSSVTETTSLVKSIVGAIFQAAWRTVDLRVVVPARNSVGHPSALLTDTELKIVQYLALGLSNKEIARRRGVSDSTIKTQVSRTGAKLGATRRSEIVAVGMSMLAPLPAQGTIDYDD